MQRDRRVVSRDQLRRDDDIASRVTREPGVVWGADGAVALYRRTALESARMPRRGGGWEILDEDFGHTKEDVDLAWRLRLLGWTCRYEPKAVAWHARSGGDSGTTTLADGVRANMANPLPQRVLSWRNQRLMQLKNESAVDLARDLPWIAAREIASLGFMVVADPLRLVALYDFVRAAPHAIAKRRATGPDSPEKPR